MVSGLLAIFSLRASYLLQMVSLDAHQLSQVSLSSADLSSRALFSRKAFASAELTTIIGKRVWFSHFSSMLFFRSRNLLTSSWQLVSESGLAVQFSMCVATSAVARSSNPLNESRSSLRPLRFLSMISEIVSRTSTTFGSS